MYNITLHVDTSCEYMIPMNNNIGGLKKYNFAIISLSLGPKVGPEYTIRKLF